MCKNNIANVVSLDCKAFPRPVSSVTEADSVAKKNGRKFQCCTVPVAGQALLCIDPNGSERTGC